MAESSFSAEINPAVLRWARESAGWSVDEAAKHVKRTPQSVKDWERGVKAPSWQVLKKLAAYYKRPVAALLLAEPPEEAKLPPDFRTLPGPKRELSPKTRLVLRTARWLQSTALKIQQELAPHREFNLVRGELRKNPEQLAESVRDSLDIDISEQRGWKSPNEALRRWREAVERQGVLVFQFPTPKAELRGFSLFDRQSPVIVVNESDAVLARIFTLFHEYGHLLLGKPGMCLPEEGAVSRGAPEVETFCNRFAAALLVPAPESSLISREFQQAVGAESDVVLRRLADRYWVSRYVILGKLRVAGAITAAAYKRISERWERTAAPRPPRKGGGGQTAAQISLRQRGGTFVSIVLQARDRGLLTTHESATYLGFKNLKDLYTLAKGVSPIQAG